MVAPVMPVYSPAPVAAAVGMTVGVHGSTFGGNPLAMAVAVAAFDEIRKEGTLANVRLLPALTLNDEDVRQILERFERTCEQAANRLVAQVAA